MLAERSRRWTKKQILDLAIRLRWELMNKTMTAAEIMFEGKLDKRLGNSETRAANFSRWLRHTEQDDRAFLLSDDELDNIQIWISNKGSISRPELLISLLPRKIPYYIQHWLIPDFEVRLKFESVYAIYRSSARFIGQIVVGRLHVTCEAGEISTTEYYKPTNSDPKSGQYEAQGGFVQSNEGDIYLLSRFSNGDLQTAVFTNANVYKSGYGENKIIRMSGVVMNTMSKKPYVARIHCEADPSERIEMGTVTIDQVPEEVRTTLRYSVDKSELNVIRF